MKEKKRGRKKGVIFLPNSICDSIWTKRWKKQRVAYEPHICVPYKLTVATKARCRWHMWGCYESHCCHHLRARRESLRATRPLSSSLFSAPWAPITIPRAVPPSLSPSPRPLDVGHKEETDTTLPLPQVLPSWQWMRRRSKHEQTPLRTWGIGRRPPPLPNEEMGADVSDCKIDFSTWMSYVYIFLSSLFSFPPNFFPLNFRLPIIVIKDHKHVPARPYQFYM